MISWWMGIAIASHGINALVFAIDKSVLKNGTRLSRPLWYAAYSGMVAAIASFFLILAPVAPTWAIIGYSLVAGVLWVGALCLFFTALKWGEPSRVVPIVGSAVPVFTWLFAAAFLHEQLRGGQWVAVGLLITGSVLLSIRLKKGISISLPVITAAVLSGALFAAYFVVVKFIYGTFDPFLAAFAYSRLGVGFVAFILLVVLYSREADSARRPERHIKRSWWIFSGFWSSKVLGMIALLAQNWAIALGSVTVVNSLQGVQYVSLLLLSNMHSNAADAHPDHAE